MSNERNLHTAPHVEPTGPVDGGFDPLPAYYPVIRQRTDPETYAAAIQPAEDAVAEAKRNFSDLIITSNKRLREMSNIYDICTEDDDRSQIYYEAFRQRIKAIAAVMDAHLLLANKVLFTLRAEYATGRLKFTRQQSVLDPRRLDALISELQAKLVALRAHEGTIAGKLADQVLYGAILPSAVDWTAIAPLVSRLTAPETAALRLFQERRDHRSDRQFRRRVLSAYEARPHGFERNPETYCCVDGDWGWGCEAVALVPLSLDEADARWLFGGDSADPNGHLLSAANALPMNSWFASRVERAELGFAPVPGKPDEYRIVPWYDDSGEEDFKQLSRTRLRFSNEFRPETGYMAFAYAVCLLRRQRLEAPGWWRGQPGHGLQRLWSVPGQAPVPRKATMLVMAMRIGNMGREEARDFLGMTPAEATGAELEAGPRDVFTSDCVQLAKWAADRCERYEPEDEWCHICERGGI